MKSEEVTGLENEVGALGVVPGEDAAGAEDPAGGGAPAQPGELTEAQLEALLFVAEKPLARAEIALLAGVDRETVDARIWASAGSGSWRRAREWSWPRRRGRAR